MEEEVGRVAHYFSHLLVAVVDVTKGILNVGDTIHIKGYTSDFTQKIESMQVEHASIESAKAGQSVGLKVKDPVREHDVIYKVS
ncbi:hypothetical protein [Candidatus Oleimmundimicrobium sp.]|uniref:hypothetical protein n=1 Tax=Candidatus Oleimmundimicrobium sp. TaxID=3060597 RepID=UPI0027184045|nr:hypothetical protein [Candidatus Oleimmundimicrobium sp.]MDO8886870.1 hypothetical protein [Candidatus Oleimmundimicrobium sp.]